MTTNANATPSQLRVQFAHGLESSPQGNKARLLAAHFHTETPAMDTRDFESCVALHAGTLRRFQPDVLVGSSFGGAVAVTLLERGLYRGPTLLLAQAAVKYRPSARLPAEVRVVLVHAAQDEVVPFEGSRLLAATGSPGCIELIACDDNHALSRLVERGELVQLVERTVRR
jgi:predicted esterase